MMSETIKQMQFTRFSKQSVIWTVILTTAYFLWYYNTLGIGSDHLVFYFIILIGYYAHPMSRRFVSGLSVFILYTFLYDAHKVFPNYEFNPVHIAEPLELELKYFGVLMDNELVTPSRYFQENTHALLDVLTGLFYLCWMPVPLLFATYLTFTNRVILLQFSLAFLLVNFIGWTIYYLYPAAAPWYVDLYGFTENFNIPGEVAGLGRFDEFFGITLFSDLYTRASNVFAAIPSLHSAYPVVAFTYGLKNKMGWVNYLFGTVMLGIWFAAVYTNHHYVIDVVLGIIVALVGIALFERVLLKTRMKDWIDRWASAI